MIQEFKEDTDKQMNSLQNPWSGDQNHKGKSQQMNEII